MIQHVEAVWGNGVLRPLSPLALAESQRVTITIEDKPEGRSTRAQWVDMAERELAKGKPVPTIEEVREALACIPGSLSDAVDEDRGEY